MTILRHSTILALASVFLLALIGSSFAACLVSAEADCCEDEHECDDPLCANGAVCHCACAYTGILPAVVVVPVIPILSGEVNSELASAFVPQLSRDLFRPPRLA